MKLRHYVVPNGWYILEGLVIPGGWWGPLITSVPSVFRSRKGAKLAKNDYFLLVLFRGFLFTGRLRTVDLSSTVECTDR